MATGTDETWSVKRLLTWASADFQKRGFEAPRLESELLLGLALGKLRIELITQLEQVSSDAQLA
jgi:hypothetical protein